METSKAFTPVEPMDADVGGDGDRGGIAHGFTLNDIYAVAISADPVEERHRQLVAVRDELRARQPADGGGDIAYLVDETSRMIRALETGDAIAQPSDDNDPLGQTSSERLDTQSPEDVLARVHRHDD